MDLAKFLEQITAQKEQQQATQKVQVPQTQDTDKTLHCDISPSAAASFSMAFIRGGGKDGSTNPSERLNDLLQECEAVKNGDLGTLEEMLITQAMTLQSLFHHFTSLASVQVTTAKSDKTIALLQIALKAQNQSRQTLQALAEIKNPKKAVFIKRQQNLLQLEQRRVQEQLEGSDNAEMDPRVTTETITIDPQLGTVESKHRTTNGKRESRKQG